MRVVSGLFLTHTPKSRSIMVLTCDNQAMTTARTRMLRLLDAHPWTPPRALLDAHRLHATLPPLRDTARTLHGHDRIAKLVPLRLELFLVHWPQPPAEHEFDQFARDTKGLCKHDIPRLKRLLLWAPTELPEQRTPRLGIPSLNTA